MTGYFFADGEVDLGFMIAGGLYELGTNPAAVESRGGELINNKGIFFPNGLLGINRLSSDKENSHLFSSKKFVTSSRFTVPSFAIRSGL